MSKANSTFGTRVGCIASEQKNNVLEQTIAVRNKYDFLGIEKAFNLKIMIWECQGFASISP